MSMPRPLAWLGPDPWPAWQTNLHFFRLFMLLHVAARSFLFTGLVSPTPDREAVWQPLLVLICVVCSAGVVASLFNRSGTVWACRLAALLVGGLVCLTMPVTANHVFLEWVILLVVSMLDERNEREAALQLSGLRWLVVVFLFYTGFQKLLYGTYFDGQFLGFVIAREERFQFFLQHFMPAAEFERLTSQAKIVDGAGPYSVNSTLFLLISNAVYVVEMVIPILLAIPKTRVIATLAACALVLLIEAGAREIVFGALMISLLLLFLPWQMNKRFFVVWILFYGYLCAAHVSAKIPMFSYEI